MTAMRLLILADIDDLHWRAETGNADLVVACGDTADSLILEAAAAFGCATIFAVKGNHDSAAPFPKPIIDLDGLEKLLHLVRSYFRMDGHHIQFNVVGAETLRAAQKNPEQHRDLIVRVAGYSDYFVDLGVALQNEIIKRTEQCAI